MNFLESKIKAKDQLKSNSRTPRLALLISLLVSYTLAIPYYIFTYKYASYASLPISTTSYFLIQILYTVITGLITPVFNMAYFVLIVQISKQSESDQPHNFTLKEYFSNFRLYKKGIGNYWWTFLWQSLWELLFLIPIILVLALISYVLVSKNLITTKSAVNLLTIFAWISIMIVFIIKELAYCLNTYAIADNNNLKIRKAMNVSKAITKGYRTELFKFYLSFIGRYLLIILTLGFGSIWLQPHINMSVYNFYKELLEKYNSKAE